METFPYLTLWYLTPCPGPLLMIVGSEQPQLFSPRHIENELQKKQVSDSLAEIDVYNSIDVLSCYVGDKNDLRKIITNFSINSDYTPSVEFTTEAVTAKWKIFQELVMNVKTDSIYQHIDWTGFADEQKSKWLKDYRLLRKATGHMYQALGADDYMNRLRYCLDGLKIMPDYPALLLSREQAEEELFNIAAKRILGRQRHRRLRGCPTFEPFCTR